MTKQAWKWAVGVTEMEVSRQGCVGPEARRSFPRPLGWPGDMGAVSGGSLDYVQGVAEAGTFSLLGKRKHWALHPPRDQLS